MNSHLMAIELGPVVQIVAAARKTRDLWFASYLLSEIAKGVAREICETCAEADSRGARPRHEYLIAPAPATVDDLDPESHFVMGDEILVLVPPGAEPAIVAERAREAAHKCWLKFAEAAYDLVAPQLLDAEAWARQTTRTQNSNEVVEVYSAWVPVSDATDYQACLGLVKRLLEGRTLCRNFPAGDRSDAGVPKSSLDGRRRSVLTPADPKQSRRTRKLRLNRGEQLDALGVTKRVWGGQKNYPSTARLAADSWLCGVQKQWPQEFRRLTDECESLAAGNEPVLGRINTDQNKFPTYPQYADFPYEGAILYSNRHHEFLEEADEDQTRLNRLKDALKPLTSHYGIPGEYYAILMADGDNVGQALKECASGPQHRDFSAALSRFAGGVRKIVEKHRGALIYAAGEDIVALLPLAGCVNCANELRNQFLVHMPQGTVADRPTLSVGIAIGHFLDGLEDILQAARTMLEDCAKEHPGKNAVAIQYRSRGGAPIGCVHGWKDDPALQINDWAMQLRTGSLPAKIAYDVRHLAEMYQRWPAASGPDSSDERSILDRAMRADLRRLLSAKQDSARSAIDLALGRIRSPLDVVNLANTIIVAGLIGKSQSLQDGRTD